MTQSRHSASALHTVSALAARTGLSPHVIRLYLRRGLIRASRRSSGGYQLFDDNDAQRLRFIRVAQSLGFTLAEIGEIIQHGRRRESPCPMVRETMQARLDKVQRELRGLQAMRRRMQEAVEVWGQLPDSVPTGNDICHLITAVARSWPDARRSSVHLGRVGRVRK